MQTLILAGGLGTRLREETEFRPKPMVDIGGRPILWHLMKNFYHQGFHDFLIAAGYKGNMIKEYFANYYLHSSDVVIRNGVHEKAAFGGEDWDVTVRDTGLSTLTGGRILAFQDLVKDDFFCTYGDGLANVNLQDLLMFHKSHGKIATVTAAVPKSRFGSLQIDSSGLVTNFHEKPEKHDVVSAGFFVFKPNIFRYLTTSSALEQGPLQALVTDNQLMAFRHEGAWQPMDNLRELQELNQMWELGEAFWKNW